MGDSTPAQQPSLRLILVTLIASVILIAVGAGAFVDTRNRQRDQDRTDQITTCTTQWAEAFTKAIRKRQEVNAALRAAETARDDSIDAILSVVITANGPDGPVNLGPEFGDTLAAYAVALDALRKQRAVVTSTTEKFPYPKLDLNCDPTEAPAA